MQKIKAWIAAARPRTLPLSISGVILGASLGWSAVQQQLPTTGSPDESILQLKRPEIWGQPIFWLAILATIGFQVLSNFANDYGDGVKGTDAHRKGEQRMVASGIISPRQMKRGMIITGIITLFVASILIFMAFGNEQFLLSFVFFNLTLAAILAAVKYTVGKSAYGYSGFGDIFVFLFFGLLSVLGSYFLFTKSLSSTMVLPAVSVGLFSAAVLNLNNMRDISSDAAVGKNTIVVKKGIRWAKRYHMVLIFFGIICALTYTFLEFDEPERYLYAVAFIPLLLNVRTVVRNKEPEKLDSELKKVALSTFAFAILFSWLH